MDELWGNVKVGVRLLRRQPGFALVAVVVLALGIGANSAMFSLVNTLLFRPASIADPSTLVGCYSRSVKTPGSYRAFSYGEYAQVRSHNDVFRDVLAFNASLVGIEEGSSTRRAFAEIVSSTYFAPLGVPLARGRAFSAAEERPGAGIPVAVASDSYWRRLGSPADFLGRQVRVNGRDFTVVGIAPHGFTATTALISPELYPP